jgi:hypothetical protein
MPRFRQLPASFAELFWSLSHGTSVVYTGLVELTLPERDGIVTTLDLAERDLLSMSLPERDSFRMHLAEKPS